MIKVHLVICIDDNYVMEVSISTKSKEKAEKEYNLRAFDPKWESVYLLEIDVEE